VTLPPRRRSRGSDFPPTARRFAFTHTGDTAIQLWLGTTATGRAQEWTASAVNGVFGAGCTWVGTGAQLLCSTVPAARGAAPLAPAAPTGPNVQEHRSGVAPVRTYQDLLTSAHDEALFTFHGTSQLALVNAATGARTALGRPGLYTQAQPSPDGQHVLVTMLTPPFRGSCPTATSRRRSRVGSQRAVTKAIATLPVADNVPNSGVPTGPRAVHWQPASPATLTWAEALDGGNPKTAARERDKVVTLAAPFSGTPADLARTEYRFGTLQWTDKGVGLLTENDRTTRRTRTWVLDGAGAAPRKHWDRSAEDSYSHPGTPVRREGLGARRHPQTGSTIYLAAPAPRRRATSRSSTRSISPRSRRRANPDGRRLSEPIVGLLADDGSRVLTRFETKNTPPATLVRSTTDGRRVTLTTSVDPAPGISGAQKQLITYARADGVQLSATLYTPAGWTPKGRLPLIFWAYPPRVRRSERGRPGQRLTAALYRCERRLAPAAAHAGYAILDDPRCRSSAPAKPRTTPTSSSWWQARRRRWTRWWRWVSPSERASWPAATAMAVS
jgi:dipeptidyl aminopeptidase/acylaminoacyl peptidase